MPFVCQRSIDCEHPDPVRAHRDGVPGELDALGLAEQRLVVLDGRPVARVERDDARAHRIDREAIERMARRDVRRRCFGRRRLAHARGLLFGQQRLVARIEVARHHPLDRLGQLLGERSAHRDSDRGLPVRLAAIGDAAILVLRAHARAVGDVVGRGWLEQLLEVTGVEAVGQGRLRDRAGERGAAP
jgi:hypothetical protein